nr:beta-mannosidase a [Quercus suber]
MSILLLVIHLSLLPITYSQNVISLVGNGWTLSNAALDISVPASLPSHAHLDLFTNQVIGDPYYGLNDFNLRWVARSNWTYSTAVPITGLSTNVTNSTTWLQFNGLDTFAEISFCGKHVANTNNQFRQWWFDVSHILNSCGEEDRILSINFGSAPLIANAIAAKPGQETWPYGPQMVYEFPNRWFIRKEQSDFGWDWGPAFAPAGPWQPAFVIQLANNEVHVRNSIVDIYREGQLNNIPPDQTAPWILNASLDYLGTLPADATLYYNLKSINNETVSYGHLGDVNCTNTTLTGMVSIPDDKVELWWPSQLGKQTLYHLEISIVSVSAVIASVTKRVGFRTIVLNEFPVTKAQMAKGVAPGNNWHFEINGHEFYAKGSNFIPPDAFWPRVTIEKMAQLFDSVIAGNQNMLRVWASGAYSPDFLYDLADERGILLWSEFEFGDALYPVDKEFLENVRQEAEYNVRRVNHHPSLALWAGGNELENLELEIVSQYGDEVLDHYRHEYEQLFLDTLLPVVFGNSKSISYAPSSTSNGWLSLNFSRPIPIVERYKNLTVGSIYGETDFYNYAASALYNDSAYPVGRFSNEFGFHSMPSIQSWRQQISERDLTFNSSVVTLRDHHFPPGGLNTSNYANSSVGQAQMTEAVEMWYPVPNKTDSAANFRFTKQISTRARLNSTVGDQDIWVAPTWASIEYDGRWKVVHYVTKDIYEPVIIAPYYDQSTGNLSVYATSDLWETIHGTAHFTWYDWSGRRLDLSTPSSVDFTIGAINTTRLLHANTTTLLHNQRPADAILHMSLTAHGCLPNSASPRTFTHENWFHPTALRTAALVDPGLTLTHCPYTRTFSVTAISGVAAWVWLDYPAGAVVNFERNAFWLLPSQTAEIGYVVQRDETHGKWVQGVTVQSLWNQTLAE